MGGRRLVVAVTVLALAVGVVSVAVAASPLLGETKSTAVHVGLNYSDTWDNAENSHSLAQRCGSPKNGHVFWFTWENTVDTDSFEVDTAGSSIDTVLSVYEGGKWLGCSDDYPGPPTDLGSSSRVNFHAQQGKTYYFAVTSYDGDDGGSFNFHGPCC